MDGFQLMQLCSWPDEVFLLLVYESQGKHGCCTVNAKSESRSWSCFWPWGKKTHHLSGIPIFCCLLWTKAPFMAPQGAASLSADPGSAVAHSLSSLLFWLLEFWQGARSPSLVLVSPCLHARTHRRTHALSPLSRSHQLSGRRIASSLPEDYPELWIFCNHSRPFHSLQPRRRVTDCRLRVSEWLLANDCYKFS